MSCYNKNTNEYKALQDIYESDIAVDMVIDTWQKMNNSEIIPSVDQINLMQERTEVQNSLDKKDFKDMLLANLSRAKIISMYKKNYWVNSSIKQPAPTYAKYSPVVLNNNLKRLQEQLNIWGLPQNAITYKQVERYNKEENKFERLVIVKFNENAIGPNDLLLESRNTDMTHIGPILDHLKSIFPQVQVRVMNVKDAENLHKKITAGYKKKPAFKNVKSFYYKGQAILIRGRVTSETAIEEVLHPFINNLAADKPELFDKLFREAFKTFPLLAQQIQDAYTDKRGFSSMDRKLELVTQALSRHFKKEHETTPPQSWKNVIVDLLKWLSEYIKDIYMEENFPPPYATDERGIPYKLKTYDDLPPHPMNEMGAVPLTRKDYGVNRTRRFSPHPIEREIEIPTNILDYYASQGNPELKRGSSTGFFPTTNYPMPGIMGLQDILDNNELIRKYGKHNDVSQFGSRGYYSPNLDEIALNKDYLKYTYGSPGNKYLDRYPINETLGHEGIHYMMYPKHRGFNKYLTDAFPYPDNYQSDYSSSDHHIQKAPYHPTIHYIDNTYFPNKWSHGEDLNFKGLQNFNQFQNITSDSDNYMEPIEDSWNYTPDRFGQNVMGAQEAMDFEIYGQGWNPTPNPPPSFNPHAGM